MKSKILNQHYIMQETPKVQYLFCQKGGYHYGETLNMVCLEPSCQGEILCCCACIQEHHKQHSTKPLRLLLLQASKLAQSITPSVFNIDIALELISSGCHIKSFGKYKKSIQTGLQAIQNSIITYYSFLIEQVKLKNIDPKFQFEKALEIVQGGRLEHKEYVYSVKRIAQLTSVKNQEKVLIQDDILSFVNNATNQLNKNMQTRMDEIISKTNNCLATLNLLSNDLLKKPSFKFSTTYKHPDIKVVSDYIVKSINNLGYRFAIMQPGLEKGNSIKDFAFKLKETSNSYWVAVGMCHKNIVAAQSYWFHYNDINHGAYIVSANGGSWSNIKTDTNKTQPFKFQKGDIICMQANFKDKTLHFKRNNDIYVLNFQTIEGDELCPCVVFYFINDEMEFLPHYKF